MKRWLLLPVVIVAMVLAVAGSAGATSDTPQIPTRTIDLTLGLQCQPDGQIELFMNVHNNSLYSTAHVTLSVNGLTLEVPHGTTGTQTYLTGGIAPQTFHVTAHAVWDYPTTTDDAYASVPFAGGCPPGPTPHVNVVNIGWACQPSGQLKMYVGVYNFSNQHAETATVSPNGAALNIPKESPAFTNYLTTGTAAQTLAVSASGVWSDGSTHVDSSTLGAPACPQLGSGVTPPASAVSAATAAVTSTAKFTG